jgi:clan AA aspartic protease
MNLDRNKIAATLTSDGLLTPSTTGVPLVPSSNAPMGVFTVRVKLSNWQNRFLPPDLRGEDVECDALVDSGAAELALPAEIIETLRLEPIDAVRVRTADGARHEYRVVGMVELEVQGRKCQVRAIELPRGARPLLGAVPLEEMDWYISPLERRLVPNPDSPDRPTLPLC